VAAVLVYGGSLSYPFVFDDSVAVVDNASIRDLWSSRVLFPARETPTAGRPLVNVSHAVNYAIAPAAPHGYRTFNLVVHLLCGLLILSLLRRTLALPLVPEPV